jgi:hypothetical protein
MIKSGHKLKTAGIFVFFIALAMQASAQKVSETSFYRHFTGKLDTSMRITLDLLFQEGKVTGYYYYYFPEPGNNRAFYYGKTIPVHGFMDGDKFMLTEFGESGSRFNCILEKNNKITGTWQRGESEKMIPFHFTEDYSGGSLPFSCYTLNSKSYLKKGKGAEKNSPKAEIKLVLLYPDLPASNPLKDSLDFTISKYLYTDTVPFKNPELLLKDITNEFFDSYHEAFDGVKMNESSASFNWEEIVSMEICYNERDIASLKIDKYAFTGGAHGIKISQYIVCDLKHNRHLMLKDIMQEDYEARLNDILNEKLRKLNGIKPEEKLKESGFFDERIETSENFYINKDGIGFFYNLYHIAPYSAGSTELFLTFNELKEILDPGSSFFWNQPGNEITGR